jgi:hypothetical protein
MAVCGVCGFGEDELKMVQPILALEMIWAINMRDIAAMGF